MSVRRPTRTLASPAPVRGCVFAGITILLGFSPLAAPPALSAATYMIAFNNGGANLPEVYSSTGFRRDTSFALVPSGGAGTLTGGAYSGPGIVRPYARVDCTWEGFGGGFWGATRTQAQTNDLIISGPPSPSTVTGTLWMHVKFGLNRSGGHANNNGHNAAFQLSATTLYSGATGTLTYGNFNLSGTGCFASAGTPSPDMLIPMTGSYPVNTPFTFTLYGAAFPSAYGNWANTPGMVLVDAGGSSSDASTSGAGLVSGGPVMTLPPGYTLNSQNWGIVNNVWSNPVGVEGEPAARSFGLDLAGPNPSAGAVRMRLTLPRESEVSVVVYDVAGRALATLFRGRQTSGPHEVVWDGRDRDGTSAPAGLYFVRADGERWSEVRRLVRLER